MDSHSSIPTPSASPPRQVSPRRARRLLFDFLLGLTSNASLPPTYPDASNDRFRGILYPAICHRIKYHAGPLSPSDSSRIFEIAQTATDLVGYLYPFHSFDLQVEICSKIVLFGLLLRRNDDIAGVPGLKKMLVDSNCTQTAEVASLVAELELRKGRGDPSLGVFGLWPVFLILPFIRDGHYFDPVSAAAVRVAITDGAIKSIINSQGVQTQGTSKDGPPAFELIADSVKECGLQKLLVNPIFPGYDFEEESYGPIYFPVLDKLTEFTEAVATITTEACSGMGENSVQVHNAPPLLQSATEKATTSYEAVRDAFRQHPQLWKFAEQYMKGYVCAILSSNDYFQQILGDWKGNLEAEWKTQRYAERTGGTGLALGGNTQKPPGFQSDKMEIGSPKNWVRSAVEEYNGWEFLR
ncbi:hypothetical protein TWF696_002483 [Orbilia brochopaga]|uniref:Uncharacterized protein n=1 Tax=Orbilia brochopaga TaxID=3140254 RepID=A0AAV9U1X6_9PEZI